MTQKPRVLPSLRSELVPRQVTKALMQVPLTDAAGPLFLSPSPLLRCWAESVPQAMLSCPCTPRDCCKRSTLSPNSRRDCTATSVHQLLRTGFATWVLEGNFPQTSPYTNHASPPGREAQHFSHLSWPSMPHKEPDCLTQHQYLYRKQHAG